MSHIATDPALRTLSLEELERRAYVSGDPALSDLIDEVIEEFEDASEERQARGDERVTKLVNNMCDLLKTLTSSLNKAFGVDGADVYAHSLECLTTSLRDFDPYTEGLYDLDADFDSAIEIIGSHRLTGKTS